MEFLLFVLFVPFLLFFIRIFLKNISLKNQIKTLKKENEELTFKINTQEKILFLQSPQAAVGELVGNISHQWKEPLGGLGAILANLQATLMIKGEVSSEKLNDSIEKSYKLLNHLIDTMEVFYRFFKSQKSNTSEFNLCDEIENIQKMVNYSMQVEQILLKTECSKDIFLYGDRGEFVNALLNIVLNAKDILIERKIKQPSIELKVSKQDGYIKIIIKDNGGGVKQEPIEKIFEYAVSSKEKSTGIGLFIVKNIIEKRMHGKIKVENKDDGALFTLLLPATQILVSKNETLFYEMEESAYERIVRLEKEVAKRSEIEKALRQWEEIFIQTHWAVAVHKGNGDGFAMVNPAFYEMYGYTSNELKNMTVSDLFALESLEIFPLKQKEAFEKSFVSFEAMNKRKDGTKFPVNIDLTVIKNEYGEILYHLANIKDITKRKLAEDDLLLKEFALGKISEAVFLIDENANFKYVNEAACKSLGYSEKELLGMGVPDIDSDVSLERFKQLWENMKNVKRLSFDTFHTRKDGVVFPVEINSNYFEYQNKSYNLATVRDITERIRLEEQKDNERMRLFFERQLVGMAITSPQKGWLHTNEKLQEMLGYTHEELSELTWVELTYPEDLAPDITQFERLLAGEIEDYMLEKRFIRKDKTLVYTNLAVSCVRNEDGSVNYVLALLEDITKRKLIEEKLRENQAQLSSIISTIPDMIWLKDENGVYITCNPAYERFFGAPTNEIIGKTDYDFIPRKEADYCKKTDMEAMNFKGISISEETITYQADGSTGIIEVRKVPIYNQESFVGVLGIGQDITKRRLMEDSLIKKEREFSSLAENIPDNIARWDTQGRYIYINPTQERLLKVAPEDIIGKSLAEAFPEIDFSVLDGAIKQVLTTREKTIIHQRVPGKNGETEIHDISLAPEFDEIGDILSILGIGRDMTDVYRLQDEIAIKEEQFRTLVENLPDTVIRYDKECRAVYVSPTMSEVFGEDTVAMLLNKTPLEAHRDHHYDAEAYQRKLENTIATGEHEYLSHDVLLPSGELQYGQIRFVAERDQKGDICGALAIGTDITKLKKSEELYKNSSNLLHSVMESSTEVTIFALDREYKYLTFNELHKNFYKNKYGIDVEKGKSFVDLVPDKDFAKGAQNSWDRALSGENFTIATEEEIFKEGYPIVEYWNNYISPIFNDKKEITGLTCFSINITKRREIEKKLESLNDTLELKVKERTLELQQAVDFNNGVINAIPDLMFEVDKKGTYLNVWAKDERLLAAQKEALLGNKISDILSEEASTTAMEAIKEAEEKGLSFGKTLKIDLADGEHWFELSSSKKADGNIIFISRDITERKAAQMKIEEEKEKFSKMFMSSPAAVSVTSLERNIYLEVNESFLYFTKYTRDEVVGKSSADLQLFANPDERAEFFRRVLEDGVVRGFEFEYRAKDGTTGYGVAYATLLTIQGERCVLAHSYDINATKQLELVNTALNTTTEAVYITDETFSIIYVNDGACKMLGYTKEELSSMKVYEVDALYSLESLTNLQEEKELNKNMVFKTKHRMKNGNIIDVEIVGSSFNFHNKIVFLSVVKDITAKKEYEEQLHLLQIAINNASEAIYIVGDNREIKYVSDAACRMLGYSVEEFLTMKVEDIDPCMSVDEITDVKDKLEDLNSTTFQTRHRAKNGTIFEVEITVTKFMFNGTDLRLSIVKDITR